MSFVSSCQKYYIENLPNLNKDYIRRHEYSIEKYMKFVVPSDVDEVKLEVDSVFLNDFLTKDEIKKVALEHMKRETRDIELVSDSLTDETLTVMKYCIKTAQTIVNGVYKFVLTLNLDELLHMFGDVLKNISADSIKKLVKYIKSIIRELINAKNYDKIKSYIENCKWLKFCKSAFGKVINFIKKTVNKIKGLVTRDLVEVEGVMIMVPSKTLAEAYKEVMKELESVC
jgi:hypothetical protein